MNTRDPLITKLIHECEFLAARRACDTAHARHTARSVHAIHAGGYYPSLFFSELAKITEELIPKFTQAYYIHSGYQLHCTI